MRSRPHGSHRRATDASALPEVRGRCCLEFVRPCSLLGKLTSDCVWLTGPEIVDKAIIGCNRVVNSRFNTVDYLKPSNNVGKPDERLVFRTLPALEREKLIFQIGTSDAKLAVEGARVVVQDVAGIDVNAGCPKVQPSFHLDLDEAYLDSAFQYPLRHGSSTPQEPR